VKQKVLFHGKEVLINMEKMKKMKKIGNIVTNVLIWLLVIFSFTITVMVFSAQQSADGIPSLFGKSLLTIQTRSMEDTYKVGDMVFMTKLSDEEKYDLKPGDIITYHAPIDINNDGLTGDINTHRIVTVDHKTGLIVTRGDAAMAGDNDDYTIHRNDVIGICTEKGKLGGVGSVVEFLRSSVGFFVCIVLPLVLFFIFELYNFISVLVSEKAKKAPIDKDTEEEIKRKAIEEYLKSQQMMAEKTDSDSTQHQDEKSSEDENK
jgi:signal peptidase